MIDLTIREQVFYNLSRYLCSKNDVLDKVLDLEEYYITSHSVKTAGVGDGMPHAHGDIHDISDIVIKDHEKRRVICDMMVELHKIMIDTVDYIDSAGLTDDERQAMYMRYINVVGVEIVPGRVTEYKLRPWGQIAQETGKSFAAVTHAHKRAIEKLTKFEENSRDDCKKEKYVI